MTNLPTPGVGDLWGSQLNAAITERAVPTGGAAGKVLGKVSSTNYDVAWVTQSGGINSIVAGTGVTVNTTDPANPIINATGGGSGGSSIPPTYLGTNAVGGSTENITLGRQYAKKITTPAGASTVLHSVQAYLNQASTASFVVKGIVWADNAGSPGTLLAAASYSTDMVIGSPGWRSFPVGIELTASTSYWIGFVVSTMPIGTGSLQVSYTTGGSDRYQASGTLTQIGDWNSAYSPTTTSNNYSIRGLVSSGGGGGTPLSRYSANLTANLTSSVQDTSIAVPDLTLTVTPPVDGFLVLNSRLGFSKGTSGRIFAWTTISPAPVAGDAVVTQGVIGPTNMQAFSIPHVVQVAGGVTYTITTTIGQGGGGSMTLYKNSDFVSNLTNASALFIPATAGGSGGTSYPPGSADIVPSAPNVKDAEFDGTSAVTWTATPTAATSLITNTKRASHLYIQASGTGAAYVGQYQPVPSSYPYTITAKLAGTTGRGNYHRGGGIILLPASPTNTTNIYYAGDVFNGNHGSQRVIAQAGGTFGSQSGATVPGIWGPNYFKVTVNSATSVSFWSSVDGFSWVLNESALNPGFTPAFMGLALNEESAGGGTEAYFDFFRVT